MKIKVWNSHKMWKLKKNQRWVRLQEKRWTLTRIYYKEVPDGGAECATMCTWNKYVHLAMHVVLPLVYNITESCT